MSDKESIAAMFRRAGQKFDDVPMKDGTHVIFTDHPRGNWTVQFFFKGDGAFNGMSVEQHESSRE